VSVREIFQLPISILGHSCTEHDVVEVIAVVSDYNPDHCRAFCYQYDYIYRDRAPLHPPVRKNLDCWAVGQNSPEKLQSCRKSPDHHSRKIAGLEYGSKHAIFLP
jgi:hypothetical protein